MRTRVSLSAVMTALAASLGLTNCGGNATGSGDASGGHSAGGESSGGLTGSGGAAHGGAAHGGATQSSGGQLAAGGAGSGGSSAHGGATATMGGSTNEYGGSGSGGGTVMNPFPCTNPKPVPDASGAPSGIERCDNGQLHRAKQEECGEFVPRVDATCTGPSSPPSMCEKDSDCTAHPYGKCELDGPIALCACSYGCRSDDDCSGGGVCVCGSNPGYCTHAACHSDADCLPGLECRTFQDPDSLICYDQRFECQTPSDTCDTDASCKNGEHCVSDGAGTHACRIFSCGIPGRPFLVEGCVRVAAVTQRADWLPGKSTGDRARDCELSPAERKALVEHWSHAAQLEHASVAAFARFVLQLLQLGAPADLVQEAQRALGDELEHARMCFALASRYHRRALGPERLDTQQSLSELDLAAITRLTLREGCIGEVVAAVQAEEALAHAEDRETIEVLSRISQDESRHAELSLRFLRWALAEAPALGALVLADLAEFERSLAFEPAPGTREPERLSRYGVLSSSAGRAIERRTIAEVVRPLVHALVAESMICAA